MQCPTCDLPLRPGTVDGELFDSCEQCGGEYFSHHAFRELLLAHAQQPGGGGSYRRPSPLSDPIHYRKCPSCAETIKRLDAWGDALRAATPAHYWAGLGN